MYIRRKPPNPKIRVDNLEYSTPHKEAEAKNILEEIVWYKDGEINNFKKNNSLEDLIKKIPSLPQPKDFLKNLVNSNYSPAVIAEIKKASPSKGIIREDFNPEEIALIYENGGASCISVLTDKKFFHGGFDILTRVRKVTNLPLLCKDFIVSAYQIYRARVSGADAILLIAAILSDNDLKYLNKIATNLKMSVLVEVHDKEELKRVIKLNCFKLIGINNRDLKTFKTDLNNTIDLMKNNIDSIMQERILFISESGINSVGDLEKLKKYGIRGVLIGEKFMKDPNIENTFAKLINSFQKSN